MSGIHMECERLIHIKCNRKIAKLEDEVDMLRKLLSRYRNEVPLGNQPHMITDSVDKALENTNE